MPIAYVTPAEAIKASGLRLVFVRGVPSPWGMAAKTLFEIKGVDYLAAPLELAGKNEEIVAWTGQNSAPVAAWNGEAPIHRWQDIILLAERIAPTPALIPTDAHQRALMWGFVNELAGEQGLGWNRRLQGFGRVRNSGKTNPVSEALIGKYGYDADAVKTLPQRIAGTLAALTAQLKAQQARGVAFLVGETLSAADIYFVTFLNLVAPLPPEQCAMPDAFRAGFTAREPEIVAALDPTLLAHRDRIFQAHFKNPMEF
jgi:glutathione S-transferase